MGNNALVDAAGRGQIDVLEALLDNGRIDVRMRTIDGHTALDEASFNGNIECVKALVKFAEPLTRQELVSAKKCAKAGAREFGREWNTKNRSYRCMRVQNFLKSLSNPMLNGLDVMLSVFD